MAIIEPSGTITEEYLRAVNRGLDSVYFGYTLTIFAIMVLSALIYAGLNLIAPPGLTVPQPVLIAVSTGLSMVMLAMAGRSAAREATTDSHRTRGA